MSGMGLIFNIAKEALNAQRYSMDVTAHNIANVDTLGYSRQSPVLITGSPMRWLHTMPVPIVLINGG